MEEKACTKCGETKEIENFAKSSYNPRTQKWYRNSWCNCCRTADNRKRGEYTKRPKPVVEVDAKECLRCHVVLPLEVFPPSQRGRLGRASYCRACGTRASPEKSRKYTSDYRERHRAKYRAAHRLTQYKRRTNMQAGDDESITNEYLIFLYSQEICCWCGEYVPEDYRTLEHIQELSQGGLHSITNTNMACRSCNSARINRQNNTHCESLLKKYEEYNNAS